MVPPGAKSVRNAGAAASSAIGGRSNTRRESAIQVTMPAAAGDEREQDCGGRDREPEARDGDFAAA